MSQDPNDAQSGGMNTDLDRLFRAYRDVCPDPDPGRNFMPELWQKIEARRSYTLQLGRLTKGFVSVAAAACLTLALFLARTEPGESLFYSDTYLNVLAEERSPEIVAYASIVNSDYWSETDTQ